MEKPDAPSGAARELANRLAPGVHRGLDAVLTS